ncbi:hypothetical protein B0T25DRAFT_545283 [Lasiosphaeria hispida]|uniref:Uncharacterized protein n=1 Tax=Lasiosphaeria hispida TaxID=260671 RepID=A0AAJ0HJV2_9PEZI|nr:hypothetical protein B0T25DRAFT_545283 [Lasiosphaeria hispida]
MPIHQTSYSHHRCHQSIIRSLDDCQIQYQNHHPHQSLHHTSTTNRKMNFFTLVALAAAAVLATPTPSTESCILGGYRCRTPNTGIEICNIQSQWELVGPCPNNTECTNLKQNDFDLPFCTNKIATRNGRLGQSPGERCTTPGKYDCYGPHAIQVCNTQNILEYVGACPAKTHCDYLNGNAFCMANY